MHFSNLVVGFYEFKLLYLYHFYDSVFHRAYLQLYAFFTNVAKIGMFFWLAICVVYPNMPCYIISDLFWHTL